MNFNKWILFSFLLVLFSCETVVDSQQYTQKISTVCILRPYLENQRVFVYETTKSIPDSLTNISPGKSAAPYFLESAQVKILYHNSIIPLHLQKDSYRTQENRYFTNQNLKIDKGNKYYLEIKYDGIKISGQTNIPEQINISHPADSTILDSKIFNLKWNKSIGAKKYLIHTIQPAVIFIDNQGNKVDTFRQSGSEYKTNMPKIQLNTLDFSKLNIYNESQFDYLNDTLKYQIKVMAIDSNLYNHFKGAKRAGLNNGYGVFGSAVMDSIDVYLPKNELIQ